MFDCDSYGNKQYIILCDSSFINLNLFYYSDKIESLQESKKSVQNNAISKSETVTISTKPSSLQSSPATSRRKNPILDDVPFWMNTGTDKNIYISKCLNP